MLNKNIAIFILLAFIGIAVHHQSLGFSLYGDDWFVIFRYLAPDNSPCCYGPLPGLLTYLTPYGPAILLMGKLFEFFRTNYQAYFVVSLFFRIFASWALFMASCQMIKSRLISFLASVLFLVGFAGIQTTDWVFYMNVYLAIGLFFLSLYYQFKFYKDFKKINILFQFIFLIGSLIVASVRLFPLIFIIPLIELSFLFRKDKKILKVIVVKIVLFFCLILLLWFFGLFGGFGGKIYPAGAWSTNQYLQLIARDPLYILNSFLHWIGIVVFPDQLIVNIIDSKRIGLLFLIICILVLFLSRKNRSKVIIQLAGCLIFFVSLFLMWIYSNFRLTSSEDRYLLFPFAGYSLLVGVLASHFIKNFKMRAVILLTALIIANLYATRLIYQQWTLAGREDVFLQSIHSQIISSLPPPLTKNDVIYLDFDNTTKLHSVVFGLGFKMSILSNTLDSDYLPNIYDNNVKDKELLLVKTLQDKISQGYSRDNLIERVVAFQFTNGKFINITADFRRKLEKEL